MALGETFQVISGLVAAGVIERYAVAGAVAAINYLEPLLTDDLDILISFEETQGKAGLITLAPILEHLRKAGFSEFHKEGVLVHGWPVQFLPVANDLDADALDQAIDIEIVDARGASIKVPTIRPEYLVAKALEVNRPKDRARIAAFLDEKAVDVRALDDVLRKHGLLDAWRNYCAASGITDRSIVELKP